MLFALDAERAHNLTLSALRQPLAARALGTPRRPTDPRLRQPLFGKEFGHPVGLAAGLDKHGAAAAAWGAMGFAFVEIGTVTPRPQPGNPRPRLFRLAPDRAIVNRFGFNSVGSEAVARNLAGAGTLGIPVGVNLGRNRDTPNDAAAADYAAALDLLLPFADYAVVNVSSPNTAGLRALQESRALRSIVEQVVRRARDGPRPVPVLVKVSPDMSSTDLLASVDAALEGGAAGIVATNTTVAREGLASPQRLARETGGLSGAPLRTKAADTCALLHARFGRRVPIIGVGGIFTADDAYERIRAGASLVQIYTALIYEGPGVVSRIVRGLSERLARDGVSNVSEVIGADVG